jgi:hypothetical protein
MSLWSKDSMRDVLKNLIDGLSEAWVKVGKYWRVPCKSAITQARQRLGSRVMSQLFHQLVKPMATGETCLSIFEWITSSSNRWYWF